MRSRRTYHEPSLMNRTAASRPGPILMLAVALAVFAGTFLVRFLTVEFSNDHFVHLSRGRQILLGDAPVRDFFDPGLFLQYYASAAALTLSGGTLLGEAILTTSAVALGATLTFVLAATLSASTTLGLAAALATAATGPRLQLPESLSLRARARVCAPLRAKALEGRTRHPGRRDGNGVSDWARPAVPCRMPSDMERSPRSS